MGRTSPVLREFVCRVREISAYSSGSLNLTLAGILRQDVLCISVLESWAFAGSNTCTGFPARCLPFMLAVALTGLALHPNQRVSPGWSIESSHSPTYRLPAFDPWLSLGYYSLVHHSFSEPCGSSLWFAGFPVFDAFSPACA
jgi:hypothetical protein